MRTALLCQDGNFVGREYFAALLGAGLAPDRVMTVGQMKAESINIERERTGGKWDPPHIPDVAVTRRFESLADVQLKALLIEAEIDIAIQGGIGIIKSDLLSAPRVGWLNVHPGKLPEYRGNGCPEWAILNGDPVIATAHLIDEGVDTGPVVCAKAYDVATDWTYFDFRANLYRHCAEVLIDALREFDKAGANAKTVARAQPTENAHYWLPLSQTERNAVRARFPLAALI
jgi:methionyl-tRNA formyltransferase